MSKMQLCSKCYDKIKEIPNIVHIGNGRTNCFGGFAKCDECGKKLMGFALVEISNKNIEIHSKDLSVPLNSGGSNGNN